LTFLPALPKSKTDAMKKMAMGHLEKVILRYEEPWWREDQSRLNFMYVSKAGTYPSFVDLGSEVKPTLMCIYGGDFAEQVVGNGSDEQVVSAINDVLADVSGLAPNEPIAVKRTDWTHDQYAFGSYSNLVPGASGDEFSVLSEPVGESLFFAGEATIPKVPQTVLGAYLSGLREAARILGTTDLQLSSGPAPVIGCG
jgi:polyamine oxidase